MTLLIIMGMIPKSRKLLNIFSVTEVMKIMPTETISNTASPSCEGVFASFSMMLGTTIDSAATSHNPGIIKIARELNQKISAGENNSVIRNHQNSGLAAASKPYLGNN